MSDRSRFIVGQRYSGFYNLVGMERNQWYSYGGRTREDIVCVKVTPHYATFELDGRDRLGHPIKINVRAKITEAQGIQFCLLKPKGQY